MIFEDATDADADPEELPRHAFLDGAVHTEAWRGLAFGVFRSRHGGYNDPDLNFFGLTLTVGLPTVETVHGATWTVLADVHDCPDLELVLPARKEAVETPFLAEMREAARLAIYRAMAADPAPRPAFEDWTRAREAGIDMAPPPALLRPWRPCLADVDDWRDLPKLAEADHDALVMQCDPEPSEAQALWRAAEQGGIAPRLFEADRRLEGYGWYDGLARATAVFVMAAADGEWMDIDDYPMPKRAHPGAARLPSRPAAIRIELTVRPAVGPSATLDLPAEVAFAGGAWCGLHDALPLVTVDSALQPQELAELLRAGFFSPSDESDSDSWETQRDRFDEEALHLATRLLLNDDEACRVSLAEAVRRELLWLCPRDRTVDIRIRRPDIAVTLAASRRRPAHDEGLDSAVRVFRPLRQHRHGRGRNPRQGAGEGDRDRQQRCCRLARHGPCYRHPCRCGLRGRRPRPVGHRRAARPGPLRPRRRATAGDRADRTGRQTRRLCRARQGPDPYPGRLTGRRAAVTAFSIQPEAVLAHSAPGRLLFTGDRNHEARRHSRSRHGVYPARSGEGPATKRRSAPSRMPCGPTCSG